MKNRFQFVFERSMNFIFSSTFFVQNPRNLFYEVACYLFNYNKLYNGIVSNGLPLYSPYVPAVDKVNYVFLRLRKWAGQAIIAVIFMPRTRL